MNSPTQSRERIANLQKLDPRFFQGKPCAFGHDGLRYASNSGCVHCIRARSEKSNLLRLPKRKLW